MRILRAPETPALSSAAAGEETARLDALEKIASSALQKIQRLQERMAALEKEHPAPAALAPVSVPFADPPPAAALAPVSVDEDAVKKGLSKLWTYLNDRAA